MNERLHKSAIFTKLFRALCLRIEGSTEQKGEGEGGPSCDADYRDATSE